MRPYAFVAAAALISAGLAAHASILGVYSTQASYDAATSGNSLVNFAGTVAPTNATGFNPPILTLDGVTFAINTTYSNGTLYEVGSKNYPPLYGNSTVLSSQQSTTNNNLVITLPGSYTAFSLLLNSFTYVAGSVSADPVFITLSDGTTIPEFPSDTGNYDFYGFTSSDAISSITLSDLSVAKAGGIDLAQLQYGSTPAASSVTPEPSSFALLGTGLLGVAGVMRKRFA